MQLALFDLDNTLLSGDSDYEWTQHLIAKGILDGASFEEKNAKFFDQYKAGTLNIFEFLDFQLHALANNPRINLDRWHAEFMDNCIRPIISPHARDLVQRHLASGDLCAIVTATNSFVTGPIAREFGVPHLVATIPAQENGAFTGKPRGTPAFKAGKIERVEAWLESLGLCWESFGKSSFYSDSHNDLPLMKKVNNPVAVDPDDTLRAHATAQGWPVISLR